ncbi:MAG: hypothetical protein OXH52_16925 [Gammaproteobacteria bacterium]|nr:hypothetical protein [Gammaproteobacteria bacterium]
MATLDKAARNPDASKTKLNGLDYDIRTGQCLDQAISKEVTKLSKSIGDVTKNMARLTTESTLAGCPDPSPQ